MAGDGVLAFGQRDRDLGVRAAIELRGPPGARSGAAGTAFVDDREQALGGQLVEVEGGRVARQRERGGRVVPAHCRGGRGDVLVQTSPGRFVQGGDRLEIGLSVHGMILSPTSVDKTVS
jgi:hypothetical protein